ncbi:hypothetical protein N431DRAFT_392368 [Stipitochalara longipes BDJ]|nr:hypothetical protein N431DRAFT_392368 [Stipitochalara longipes BDJ]
MDILLIAHLGTALVANTTKYLSTLPHPIECLEELVSVVAVTSNLLISLNSTLSRFPALAASLSPKHSFIGPLCEDVKKAFRELEEKVLEAKGLRIFEPNDVGLVRLPRNAWVLVMRGEHRAASLRSKLYVEKYRVRVLIEAVCWVGLNGKGPLTEQEMMELKGLRGMLPLIAERLVGVQKDYVPRLKTLMGADEKQVVSVELKEERPAVPVAVVEEKKEMVKAFKTPEPSLFKMPMSGKLSIHSSASTDSLASTSSSSSSATAFDDSIQEVWLLRRNEAKRKLKRSIAFLGVKWYYQHSYEPASFYVKPLPSCHSDIKTIRAECRGSSTDMQHQSQLRKTILKMPDEAQWEIQKLIEAREKASSSENVRREWEVVAFKERPRRKISPENGKWWQMGQKKGLVEWVVVLRGETADRKTRVLPIKHEDPWNPKPKAQATVVTPAPVVPAVAAPAQVQGQTRAQVPAGTVLRHVENRRAMTAEEAQKKMDEIVGDLFRCEGEAL